MLSQGLLPRMEPFPSEPKSGVVEWRCKDLYTLPMLDAGIGCVLRALCSATACSPAELGLFRDKSLSLSGGLGLTLTFSELQRALSRLRESPVTADAPAGAIVLRRMRNFTGGWNVLAFGVGVYIFGAWLRTLSGAHHSHAVCYNAEARVLYLGMVTLAILDSDLADIGTFVESIELDYGVYCREHTDARQVYMSTTHAGASQLPLFPRHIQHIRKHTKKRMRP